MLRNIAEEFNTEKNENLKDAISSIVELVILDDVTLEATVMYRIGYPTGDKLASPRGFRQTTKTGFKPAFHRKNWAHNSTPFGHSCC